MGLNDEYSNRLAGFDTQLAVLRNTKELSWLDDIADEDVDTFVEGLKATYTTVETGPAYTPSGYLRSSVQGVWVSWPTPEIEAEPTFPTPPPEINPPPAPSPEPVPSDLAKFRLGATYFGAVGAVPDAVWQRDLRLFASYGYNVLRVCMNWNRNEPSREMLVKADGSVDSNLLERFGRFLSGVQLLGMKIDITFFGGDNFNSFSAHALGLSNLLNQLKAATSVIYCVDVCNEFEGSGYTASQVTTLVNTAKSILPKSPITASCSGDPTSIATHYGDLYTLGAKLDLVAPHMPRTTDWATEEGARILSLRGLLTPAGPPLIYMQEEAREGTTSGWSPSACVTAASAAKALKVTAWKDRKSVV